MSEPDPAEFARALFEESGDGLFLFDPDTEAVLDANPMAQRLCGFTRRELLRHPIHYLFRAEGQGGLGLLRQAYRKTGLFHSQEGFFLRHQREGLWVPVNLTVTRLHAPARTLGLITARDVSERRNAQLAVQRSEAELRRVLDSVSAYLWSAEFDAAGRPGARYYSPGVERVTGRPVEFFLPAAERWLSVVHPDDLPRVRAHYESLRAGALDGDENEYRMVRPDGSAVWVHTSVKAHPGGGARATRLDGVVMDVTPRRLAEESARAREEATRATEAKYRTLVENLEQCVFLKNAESRFVTVNRPMCQALGVEDESQVAGRTDEDFYRPELAARYRADDRRVLVEGRRLEVEEENLQSGQRRVVRTVKTPLRDGQGRIVGVLGIFWDVTEQRALEAQLRQAQKMEAVGQLAGGIAHDFNNLLTAVLGNLSLLLSGLPADDPRREFAAAAERAAHRAATLTGQLLGFARRGVLRPRPLSLNASVEEVLALLRRTIDPRIRLEAVTADDLATVEADPGQMTQVLMNLCLNARDAMPEGGRLLLETAGVVVEEGRERRQLGARPGAFVRLSVSDTGCGMPPEVRERIFEPFFTTKGPGQGTGLGLAMVFGIVQQHGGWVECDSEVGRGSRFDVYLPCAGEAPDPAAAPPAPAARGNETILLVDDEEMIRKVGGTILGRYGYRVLLAEDGEHALEVYREHAAKIDLVILDQMMPRLSGRDAFRRLLEINPRLRVLFSSGYSGEHLTADDRRRAAGFVNKPYRPEDLARTVRAILDETRL